MRNKVRQNKEYQSLTLSCVVCLKELEGMDSKSNHPLGGLEFVAVGHYGTTVFDPMDGSKLAINICDPCLRDAIKRSRVVGNYSRTANNKMAYSPSYRNVQ
jgi:hypothetical protein